MSTSCSGGMPQPLSSTIDRKSTRLNSSHDQISYAVFCLKKKKKNVNSSDHVGVQRSFGIQGDVGRGRDLVGQSRLGTKGDGVAGHGLVGGPLHGGANMLD